MPSRYSSEHSRDRRRGPRQAARPARPHRADRSRWSTPSRPTCTLAGLAAENLQARVRGVILMALSNAEGHLVLDHRQQERARRRLLHALRRLGRAGSGRSRTCRRRWSGSWRGGATRRRPGAAQTPPIPENSITKPPSAELRPGPARHRLAARLRGARRRARRLRGGGHGRGRAGRRRARPGPGGPGDRGWSTAPSTSGASTRPGPKISPTQLRPRPPPADHQPLGRATPQLTPMPPCAVVATLAQVPRYAHDNGSALHWTGRLLLAGGMRRHAGGDNVPPACAGRRDGRSCAVQHCWGSWAAC